MKLKHIVKIIISALTMLFFIGILCYRDVSPIDVISGATSKENGLQDGGALTYFRDGTGR